MAQNEEQLFAELEAEIEKARENLKQSRKGLIWSSLALVASILAMIFTLFGAFEYMTGNYKAAYDNAAIMFLFYVTSDWLGRKSTRTTTDNAEIVE